MPDQTRPADLLALRADGLAIANGTLRVATNGAEISSATTVFNKPGTLGIRFSVVNGALATSVVARGTQVAYTDLVASGWIASSVSFSTPLVFDSVEASASGGRLTLTGSIASPTSVPPFGKIGGLSARLAPGPDGTVAPGVPSFTGSLATPARPIVILPPTSLSGWRICTTGGDPVAIEALGSVLTSLTGADWGTLLAAFPSTGLKLADFNAEVARSSLALVRAEGTILTSGDWTVVPGVLTLRAVALRFSREVIDSVAVRTGEAAGRLTLFGIDTAVSIPLGSGDLLISCGLGTSSSGIANLTSRAGGLVGSGGIADIVPQPIASLGGFTLERVDLVVGVAPGNNRLKQLRLAIGRTPTIDDGSSDGGGTSGGTTSGGTSSSDVAFYGGLSLVDFRIDLTVDDPLGTTRTSGDLRVSIGSTDSDFLLAFRGRRGPGDLYWMLSLESPRPITVSVVTQLLGVSGVTSLLPEQLQPGLTQFGVTAIETQYDFAAPRVVSSRLEAALDGTWKIVPDHIELDALTVVLERKPAASDGSSQTDVTIRTLWSLGSAHFAMSAVKQAGREGWQVGGVLVDGTGNCSAMIGAGIGESVTLPSFLPANITLDAASFAVDTGPTRQFDLALRTSVQWNVGVGGKAGSAAGFAMALRLTKPPGPTPPPSNPPPPPTPARDCIGTRDYALAIAGMLAIEGLPSLTVSARASTASPSIEFVGRLQSTADPSWHVAATANAFGGAGDWTQKSGSLSGLASLEIANVSAYISIPKQGSSATGLMVVTGTLTGWASATLLFANFPGQSAPSTTSGGNSSSSTPPPAPQPRWGYGLILTAGSSFSFASLGGTTSGGTTGGGTGSGNTLADLDHAVPLTGVSLAIANFDSTGGDATWKSNGDAGVPAALQAAQAGWSSMPAPPSPDGSAPPARSLPALPADLRFQRGLNVFGSLSLSGANWDGLRAVLEFGSSSSLQVHGVFDPARPATALFEARVTGVAKLLSIVDVADLYFAYRPSGDPRLLLSCTVSLGIPKGSGIYVPRFAGDIRFLKVPKPGDPQAKVDGAQAIVAKEADDGDDGANFLGIPCVHLRSLKLEMTWAFATSDSPTTSKTIRLLATVKIADIDCIAAIAYRDGQAQRIGIDIAGEISMTGVFAACLGLSDAGSSMLPDLRISDGEIFYVPERRQGGQVTPASYGARAHLGLLGERFLLDFTFDAGHGLTATGQLEHRIEAVIKVTGPDGTHGPLVRYTSNDSAVTSGGVPTRIDNDRDTKGRVIAFGFGLDIFGTQLTQGWLRYYKHDGRDVYAGQITYSGTLPAIGHVDWTFGAKWDSVDRFQITEWPFNSGMLDAFAQGKALQQVYKIAKVLENADSDSVCGALGDLGLGADAITGTFRVSPKFQDPKNGSTEIGISVEVTYTLHLRFAGLSYQLMSASVTSAPKRIAPPSSIGGLFEALALILIELAPNMAIGLLHSPDALKKLAAIAGVKMGVKVLERLLCRTRLPTPPPPPPPPLPPFPPPGFPPFPPIPPIPLGPGHDKDSSNDDSKNNSTTDDGDQRPSDPPSNDAAVLLDLAKTNLTAGQNSRDLAVVTGPLLDAIIHAEQARVRFTDEPKKAECLRVEADARTRLKDLYRPAKPQLAFGGPAAIAVTWSAASPPAGLATITYGTDLAVTSGSAAPTVFHIAAAPPARIENAALVAGASATMTVTAITALRKDTIFEIVSETATSDAMTMRDYGVAASPAPYVEQRDRALVLVFDGGNDAPPAGTTLSYLVMSGATTIATIPYTPASRHHEEVLPAAAFPAGQPRALTLQPRLGSLLLPTVTLGQVLYRNDPAPAFGRSVYDGTLRTLLLDRVTPAGPAGFRVQAAQQETAAPFFDGVAAANAISLTLPLPATVAAGTAVSVRLGIPAATSAAVPTMLWGAWQRVTLAPPAASIASVAVEQVGSGVAAVIVEGDQGADQISMRWLDPNGQPTGPTPVPLAGSGAHARHELALALPLPQGPVVLEVTGRIGTVATVVRSASLQILSLAAPTISLAGLDPASFMMSAAWTTVPNAARYRVELYRTDPVRTSIATADYNAPANSGGVPAGATAGIAAFVRVAALPASGPGAVWSLGQAAAIGGAHVTLSRAAADPQLPQSALPLTVRQDQPAGGTTITLAPGDNNKALGAAAVAAFTIELRQPLTGVALVRAVRYGIANVVPQLAVTVPASLDWPTLAGTTLNKVWGIAIGSAAPIWSYDHPPLAMAAALADALAGLTVQVAAAQAIDRAEPTASQLGALFALNRDPEAAAAVLLAGESSADVDLVPATMAGIGMALDLVTAARLRGTLRSSSPTRADQAAAVNAAALALNAPLDLFASGLMALGLDMNAAAVALRANRPQVSAADTAAALAGAAYGAASTVAYATMMATTGVPLPVVVLRLVRRASAMNRPISVASNEQQLLIAAAYRELGVPLADAASRLQTTSAFIADAYAEQTTTAIGAVRAIVRVYGLSGGSPQRLAWALACAGFPFVGIVDAVFPVPPDGGVRANALQAMVAPMGAPALAAALTQAAGSPFAAIRAARATYGTLSPEAWLIVIARVFGGLAGDASLMAGALRVSGKTPVEAANALRTLYALTEPGAADAAVQRGQGRVASFLG